MSRKTHSTLIGAFVLGALAIALGALFLVAGGDLWKKKSRYLMYFDGSVYGLQVGAPVVFRGVQIGMVRQIGIALDTAKESFYIPVEIELLAQQVVDLKGEAIDINPRMASGSLIESGLRAQLAMQSLLTGQLYIDLDFHPNSPDTRRGSGANGMVEIPTIPTSMQQFMRRLGNINFEALFHDISALAKTLHETAGSDQFRTTLQSLQRTMNNLERLSGRMAQDSPPLIADVRSTLAEMRQAMTAAQTALGEVSAMAANVREASADNSLLQHNLHRALKETTRAATAIRQLSDSIEQQPEALLRGKGEQ